MIPHGTAGSSQRPAPLSGGKYVSAGQFLKLLVESRLFGPEDVQAFLKDVPNPLRNDVLQLGNLLIRQNKLTPYQAASLLKGEARGLVLGNYVMLEKIGKGGMGTVFKAMHRSMKRVVAIKVLSPSVAKSPQHFLRFRREVELGASLNHPNVAAALDAAEDQGFHFLSMEYVEGLNLTQLVRKSGPMGVREALACLLQAARGLEHAHSRGIIHRDLKPSNLVLDTKGTVKILDMGLARVLDNDGGDNNRLTQSGTVMGSCEFMAPEQAVDVRKADQRSDIYSLGCTFYFLLTGKTVFRGDSALEQLMGHAKKPAPSLLERRPEVPKQVDALFQKMLAKRPDDRYQTARELQAALKACLPGSENMQLQSLASRTARSRGGATNRFVRPKPRRWFLIFLLLFLLFLALAGGAIGAYIALYGMPKQIQDILRQQRHE